MRGAFSFQEISTQGESLQSAIDATWKARKSLLRLVRGYGERGIVFIGCGSTHYLALYAAPFFQQLTGIPCRAVPSSELYFLTDSYVGRGQAPLVVALSRSGDTSETIMAADKMRSRGSDVMAISCYDDTGLSAISTLTVDIPGGREESFAQTRSFAGMLVAVQMLAALVAEDGVLLDETRRLPALATCMVERSKPVARGFGTNESYRRISYLGSGPLYGLASEATVKVKEMSLSVAEAYHFMEFRHGPVALIDHEHLVVGLLSDKMRDYEIAVLQDLKQRGASVLAIADREEGFGQTFEGIFELRSLLSEAARGVLYLPLLQLLAYYRSMERGLDPDRPRNVIMAIRLTGAEMVNDG